MPRPFVLAPCLLALVLVSCVASAFAEDEEAQTTQYSFTPAEFSPSSEAERALLADIAKLLSGVPLDGKTGPLEDQTLEAMTRYLKEFTTGKFVHIAKDTVISILRKSNRPEELLALAQSLIAQPTPDRLHIAIGLVRNHAAITGDPAKAVALLAPLSKSGNAELAWKADVGVAMTLSSVGKHAEALKALQERPDDKLAPGARIERAHASGVVYERLAAQTADPAARRAIEDKMLAALDLVMAACVKQPAANAQYAHAFQLAGTTRMRRLEKEAAVTAFEHVAKLYPGTMEAAVAASAIVQAKQLGNPAPAIESTTMDGKPFSLAACKGKIVIVDFWGTLCAPCVIEMPNLVKMSVDFAARPLAVVSISLDVAGREKLVGKFVAEKKMTWPQLYDGKAYNGSIARAYEVFQLPNIFVLDETGKVQRVNLFGDELRAYVDAELTRLEKQGAPK